MQSRFSLLRSTGCLFACLHFCLALRRFFVAVLKRFFPTSFTRFVVIFIALTLNLDLISFSLFFYNLWVVPCTPFFIGFINCERAIFFCPCFLPSWQRQVNLAHLYVIELMGTVYLCTCMRVSGGPAATRVFYKEGLIPFCKERGHISIVAALYASVFPGLE